MTEQDIEELGYTNVRTLPNGDIAALCGLLFTVAIVSDLNESGYGDRWCYADYDSALAALDAWDGEGEPQDWHRHPDTGRRRENGDPKTEYINW